MINWIEEHQFQLAATFLRIALGIIFLFQGYDKLFGIGIRKVTESFRFEMRSKKVPGLLISSAAIYSSVVEFTCAILLISGFLIPVALILLALDLLLVIAAMSLLDPTGDLKIVFPRLVLLLLLFALPHDTHLFSLDHYFFLK